MRFFGLKSCDTCRKALAALKAQGITPEVIDVRADGLSVDDITAIVQAFGDQAINRASTTWRGLSEDARGQDTAALLAAHPTLMKRPVIASDDGWTIGWKPDVQAKYLGS
ncbi:MULTISPECIES: arsenate reductase family protein [unclassified Yoonia]|uniref:arsenate reductase family protein n=1 Tax=unclassified Yoonia TaxID=2629118 RepID=UPI002AFF75BF|nr:MULTISPECIES: ArsC/Spx/MgsR family protein [unclassified Yoonia]